MTVTEPVEEIEGKTTQLVNAFAETAAVAVAETARAQIESRFKMALARPRDLDRVRSSLLKECSRTSFAEVALYAKPVGGKKDIVGPGIRFAEAAFQTMGNLYQESLVMLDDEEKRSIRISVTDLETNATMTQDVTVLKTVERRSLKRGEVALSERLNSYEDTVYVRRATDDEILGKVNANTSKAIRNLVLRLVPGWLVEDCVAKIWETRQADVAQDPDAERNRLVDAFFRVNVTVDMLTEFLGKPPGRATEKDLVELREIYKSLKDAESTWEEVMEAKKPSQAAEEVVDGFAEKGEKKGGK